MLFPWEVEACGLFELTIFRNFSQEVRVLLFCLIPCTEKQKAKGHQALMLAWPILGLYAANKHPPNIGIYIQN